MDESDSERVTTINFLASEALDNVPWQGIYRHKMELFDISPEEVKQAILDRKTAKPAIVYPPETSKTITLASMSDLVMFPKDAKSVIYVAAVTLVVLPVSLWLVVTLTMHCPPLSHLIKLLISCEWFNEFMRTLISLIPLLTLICVPLYMAQFLVPPTHLFIGPVGLVASRFGSANLLASMSKSMLLAARTGYSFDQLPGYSKDVVGKVGWTRLASVTIDPKSRTKGARVFCFRMHDGRTVKLRLGDLLTKEVRQELLAAFSEWAPQAIIDQEVRTVLEGRPDTGYTELWISALSAPPSRERISPLEPGTVFGADKYDIEQQLGSGGQGTVYLAKYLGQDGHNESSLDGKVAIKEYILPIAVTRDAKRSSIESIEHEARILQKLDNKQIVKLLDFFIKDHRGYLVFEYVKGTSLRSLVQSQGAVPEERVNKLANEMIHILEYLHSQSPPLIHRDFTPDNLILTEDGLLKLIDFNVAQSADNFVSAIVVGKRSYTPPEQLKGKPVPQSDIYALGATIYFLLTAEDPEPLGVAHPKSINPLVSKRLDAIVAKCTQLSTENRYQTAKDIMADITIE